jgi:hypothetical protein
MGWIGSKESNLSRGFPADWLRHINQSKNYWKLEGPNREKGCHLLPQDRTQRSNTEGAAAALVAMGAGAPVTKELD